jgi:hypothetical protein
MRKQPWLPVAPATCLTLTLALLWPLVRVAKADVPPPPNYVESCTVAKQCRPGEEGTTCGTYHGEPDKCRKLHASDGFVHKCNTRGASVWSEVYCRPKGKTAASVAPGAAKGVPAAAGAPAAPATAAPAKPAAPSVAAQPAKPPASASGKPSGTPADKPAGSTAAGAAAAAKSTVQGAR